MKILFQGDSITDCGRSYQDNSEIGSGYPVILREILQEKYANDVEILNRGISGNRVVDLYARMKKDMINHKPDVISILIGVNDSTHEIFEGNGVEADRFELIYDMMLDYTFKKLPDARLIILEPFITHGSFADEHWDYYSTEVRLRARAAEKMAQRYNGIFVPLQKPFDEACANSKPEDWTLEGVHPTGEGHKLIAKCWLEGFEKLGL